MMMIMGKKDCRRWRDVAATDDDDNDLVAAAVAADDDDEGLRAVV